MNDHPPRAPDGGATLSDGIAAKLDARRRRVRAIRARVAGLSVATLMATSGVVLVQMVSGNDPALAKTHAGSDARATTSVTQVHKVNTSRHRSSRSSRRAASTPATVTTRAS